MTDNEPKYLPLTEPQLLLPYYPQLPQWMIDLLDEAGDKAFETMVEQMRINPNAIEALYG